MKTSNQALKIVLACVAVTVPLYGADINEKEFNELKDLVGKLTQKVERQTQRIDLLEKGHTEDQKVHDADQQKIQLMDNQLRETQQSATDAIAASATQTLPDTRVPLDEATVNHSFSILGDAEFQFVKTSGQHGAFLFADFAPIFLYRGGENVLFEAGFDFAIQNNAPNGGGYSTGVNLSFAQLDYLANDYMTLSVGNMVLPLGTYSERSAGWLNKFPDSPLARNFLPGVGVGAQLRGAAPLGDAGKLFNYSIYGVNGPSSADGTGNAGALDLGGNVGLRSDNMIANLHGHPTGGGRLAVFLPYKPHFDLELGISGQSGEWDNAGAHTWSGGAIDASLHLGPFFEAKGEYIRSWYGSDDMGNIRPEGFWAQAGYKLAGLNLDWPLINNVELLFRYDRTRDGLGTRHQRYTAGFVYYFTNTLLLEGDYETLNSNDLAQEGNTVILQLSYGF